MATLDITFSGGVDAVPAYGDRWNIAFGGVWVASDLWNIGVTADVGGDFIWGAGDLLMDQNQHALSPMNVCFTFKDRVFVGLVTQFNFSDNYDPINNPNAPAQWEQQYPGAGFQMWLSQYGYQDSVKGFGVLQGRLAVFGEKTIQIWIVDADPTNFALQQVLDNSGTEWPLTIQQLGDYDVIYLDPTGFRSARAKEVTLNADIDDIGSPVDVFAQEDMIGLSTTPCGIVEPKTKNYWTFLNDKIYVLARHKSAKVLAWSTYEPRGDDNTLFTPQKFVVLNSRVYCRSVEGGHYVYGGADNNTYDKYTTVTFVTPFLDDKRPGDWKEYLGMSAAMAGRWVLSISADPLSNQYINFPAIGTADAPDALTDSTYDVGSLRVDIKGTHFSIKGVSQTPMVTNPEGPVIFSQFVLYYNHAERVT